MINTTFLGLAERTKMAIQGLEYQTVGIIVVFSCLIFIALVLTVSGSIASKLNARKKAKTAVAAAAVKPASAPTRSAAPVPAVSGDVSPEVIAAISAAVYTALGGISHRILEIKQSANSAYSVSGRTEIFASHRISPVRRS